MVRRRSGSRAPVTPTRSMWTVIGRRLRVRRTQLGVGIDQVADSLGVSPVTYAAYEAGTDQAPAFVLNQVAELLDVPLVWFFQDITFVPEEDEEAAVTTETPHFFAVATLDQRIEALAQSFRQLDLEGQQHLLAIAGALSRSNRQ